MKGKKPPKYCATLAEYARIEGVSRATATRRDKAGQVAWTDDTPPRIDLAGTRQLVREMSNAGADPRLIAARLRILEAEGRMRELRLRQREGNLVPRSEVEDALTVLFAEMRQSFRFSVQKIWHTARAEEEQRAGVARTGDIMDAVLFNAWVHFHEMLAIVAETDRREAVKMAKKAWDEGFALRGWAEHWERLKREGAEWVTESPALEGKENASPPGRDISDAKASGRGNRNDCSKK